MEKLEAELFAAEVGRAGDGWLALGPAVGSGSEAGAAEPI